MDDDNTEISNYTQVYNICYSLRLKLTECCHHPTIQYETSDNQVAYHTKTVIGKFVTMRVKCYQAQI